MNVDDCEIIVKLINELQAYQHLEASKISVDSLRRDGGFTAEQPVKYFHVIIAEDDEVDDGQSSSITGNKTILGYVLYYYAYQTAEGRVLWLEDIYVRSEYRARKAGAALMREVIRIARNFELAVRLEVLDWNKDSIAFYERFGARYLYTKDSNWLCYRIDFKPE